MTLSVSRDRRNLLQILTDEFTLYGQYDGVPSVGVDSAAAAVDLYRGHTFDVSIS